MRHKKSLLALAAFGVLTIGSATIPDTYSDSKWTTVAVNCGATYKVEKDYSSATPTRFTFGCPELTFDLNGKKIDQGLIDYTGAETSNITLIDSVGGGYIKSWTGQAVGSEVPDTVIETGPATVSIKSGVYEGIVKVEGGATTITGGTISGSITVAKAASLEIVGGIINSTISGDTTGEGKITISGGTFSEAPDEKYLYSHMGTTMQIYEIDGKYVVAAPFRVYVNQFSHVGSEQIVYGIPDFVWDTVTFTSSDESVVKISDYTPTEDDKVPSNVSKYFKFAALKPGKVTISYTAEYIEPGTFDMYIAEYQSEGLSTSSLKAAIGNIETALYCFSEKPKVLPNCSTAGPSFRADTTEDVLAMTEKVAAAIKDGHTLKLSQVVELSTLSEAQKAKISEDYSNLTIGDVYDVYINVYDVTSKKDLATVYGSSEAKLPIGSSYANKDLTLVHIYGNENAVITSNMEIVREGNSLILPATIGYDTGKYAILYETSSDTPAVPNSAGFGDEASMAIIIGASVATFLAISAPVAYLIYRKKAASKVRF